MAAKQSIELAQNFLRNRRVARQLAHWAGEPELLCVDLGAGRGTVTDACLRREGAVVAIESDHRLAEALRQRFASEPRVTVVEGDIESVLRPAEPFVIAANPPFNRSTAIVRTWFTDASFTGAAMIVEKRFVQRVSGHFGATKISLSLAPYVTITMATDVSRASFQPQPRVPAAIMTARRVERPDLSWHDRQAYAQFVNYLFEQGSRTVGEALAGLVPRLHPRRLATRELRHLTPSDAIELWRHTIRADATVARRVLQFDDARPPNRRGVFTEPASPRRG